MKHNTEKYNRRTEHKRNIKAKTKQEHEHEQKEKTRRRRRTGQLKYK